MKVVSELTAGSAIISQIDSKIQELEEKLAATARLQSWNGYDK